MEFLCMYALICRYVILPKDFEKGYRANVKKGDAEFAFYQ
jgi:26S proteasome regulatory subunit T3